VAVSPPQIAIATNNGDIGGGEVMLLNIATVLSNCGVDVLVIGPTGPGDLVAEARTRGFRTLALRAENRPQYVAALARWRLRHRDVLLWCNGLVPSFATSGLGPRLTHLHIVPTGRNATAARIGTVGARRVLVPSQFMATRVPRATVLENWTEEIPFHPRTLRADRPLRVGFLGRLTQDKGVDVLARAIGVINARADREVTLVLAGANRFGHAGDDRAIEAALAPISSRVERLGWVQRDELLDHLDLAVFPSVWDEPFGLVAAEAMAAGVPFVISDAGALPEVAGPDHPWIARRGDADDLARVISRALDDLASGDDHRARTARHRWEQKFSPRAGQERVVDLLGRTNGAS
jgi:glycosyltransferase involved in cell wall biosynthesis